MKSFVLIYVVVDPKLFITDLENTWDTRNVVAILSLAHLNLIKSLLTWQAVERCPVTFVDLVTGDSCHKFFCVPTPFLSLGRIMPQESKTQDKKPTGQVLKAPAIAGAFRTWTSSCKWCKWWSRLTNCQFRKQKRLANHFMSFMSCQSISSVCHVAKLSFCYTLLIIVMHHSKTSTEAPYTSVGRASVGRQHGPSKTGARKPILNKHDTQTWPLNQPTGKHKQANLDLCLHQGNGGWKTMFQRTFFFKFILPKMLCWNQRPGKAGPHKSHSCSTILEDCNCSQNWDIDRISVVAQGKLGPFFAASWTLCVLLVARYTGKGLSLRNLPRKMWKVKPHFEPLDTGTSAPFIIHWAQRTSGMSHLPNGKIRFTVACSHNSPDEYTALVVLSTCSKKTIGRSIICCPIFELPDWMRCNLIANRLRWLGCHCLQHLVAIAASLPPRFSWISPSRLGMHPRPNRQCLADLTRHGGMDEFPIISWCLEHQQIPKVHGKVKWNHPVHC